MKHRHLNHLPWNYPQVIATWRHWSKVNIGVSNGKVLSDSKPLPNAMLTHICCHMMSLGHSWLMFCQPVWMQLWCFYCVMSVYVVHSWMMMYCVFGVHCCLFAWRNICYVYNVTSLFQFKHTTPHPHRTKIERSDTWRYLQRFIRDICHNSNITNYLKYILKNMAI